MTYKPNYYIYWDSCVFLSWLEKHPDRHQVIQPLFRQVAEKQGKILTSVISIAEVAYIAQEKLQGTLDVAVEQQIDALWRNPAIQVVETPEYLMQQTRRLMRGALVSGWKLKPADAIHLATAEWVNKRSPTRVKEFHTYDEGLEKYQTIIGVHICTPYVDNIQRSMFD